MKTPKIKAALGWAPGDAFGVNPSVTYRRGVNLSKLSGSYPRPDLRLHGTLIAGTLVGGTPGVTRYSGVASDADLLVASYNNVNTIQALAWAKAEGAQVVNWALARWVDEFLDGSTNLEDACDQAGADGMIEVVAAGNLASQLATAKQVGPIPTGLSAWVKLEVTDGHSRTARTLVHVEPAVDVAPVDAGQPDAGTLDAGTADAGPADAGPADAGPADAGMFAGPGGNRGCGCSSGPAGFTALIGLLAMVGRSRPKER